MQAATRSLSAGAPPARTPAPVTSCPAGRAACARPRLAPPAAAKNPFAAFFKPSASSPSSSASPGTAAVVDELLALAKTTRAGIKTPPAKADRIAELARQLSSARGRSPTTRSPFFFGRYAVTYCSNPAAPGGPVLTSGLGRAVAADQRPQQILEPGLLTNRVSFKALGLLPNTAGQTAALEITGPHSYRVTFDKREKNNVRDFEVLYLDGRVRVAEYTPADGRPAQLFVFERLGDVGEEEEEEEEFEEEAEAEDEEAAPSPAAQAPAFSLASFFAKPRAVESLATIVERESAAADRRAAAAAGGGAGAAAPPAAAKRRPAPPRSPPAPKQAAPPAPAPSPPQMLTILRRPGAAPKAASGPPAAPPRPDPGAAAREAVARFADAAKAAAAEARDAAAAARAASAEAAPILRQTAGQRAAVGRAAAIAEAAEAEFEEAAAALREAEAEVKRAADAVRFLEKQRA